MTEKFAQSRPEPVDVAETEPHHPIQINITQQIMLPST